MQYTHQLLFQTFGFLFCVYSWNQVSVVTILTMTRARSEVQIVAETRVFSLPRNVQAGSGSMFKGYRDSFPYVLYSGRSQKLHLAPMFKYERSQYTFVSTVYCHGMESDSYFGFSFLFIHYHIFTRLVRVLWCPPSFNVRVLPRTSLGTASNPYIDRTSLNNL